MGRIAQCSESFHPQVQPSDCLTQLLVVCKAVSFADNDLLLEGENSSQDFALSLTSSACLGFEAGPHGGFTGRLLSFSCTFYRDRLLLELVMQLKFCFFNKRILF